MLRTIAERNLVGQIDYVLYSADFPTAVDVTADIGKQALPKVLTPQASINALTYLYQPVLAKNAAYLDLNVNRYAIGYYPKAGWDPGAAIARRVRHLPCRSASRSWRPTWRSRTRPRST